MAREGRRYPVPADLVEQLNTVATALDMQTGSLVSCLIAGAFKLGQVERLVEAGSAGRNTIQE